MRRDRPVRAVTSAMWFGYARMDLLPAQDRGAIADAIHRYAEERGLGAGTVVFEPFTAAAVLRGLLDELDRAEPAAAVLPRLHGLAHTWGIDLGQVFDDTVGTAVLWQLIERLDDDGPAHLIVPTHEHLTELNAPARAAAGRLAESRTIALHFLDGSGTESPLVPGNRLRVLAETPIGAIPAVAQLDVATELIRAGRTAAIEAVDAVYVALLNEVDRGAREAGFLALVPDSDPAIIRLLSDDAGQLIVELEQPYSRVAALPAALTELCDHTDHFVDGGRTWTRCTVRLPADTVRGRHA